MRMLFSNLRHSVSRQVPKQESQLTMTWIKQLKVGILWQWVIDRKHTFKYAKALQTSSKEVEQILMVYAIHYQTPKFLEGL